jgi:hypothetical protein
MELELVPIDDAGNQAPKEEGVFIVDPIAV